MPTDTTGPLPPTSDPPNEPNKRARRRRKRWLLATPLVLIGLALLLLQTPAAAWLVEPVLENQTGMEVQTGSVRVSPTGKVIITDAVLRAPDIPGPAGRVLAAERITARIDWASVLTGSPSLKSLVMFRPELRLSQDIESGVFNVAAFETLSGGGAGPAPTVAIKQGVIELGEHRRGDADAYTPLRRWSVVGDVTRADASGVSAFSLAAMPIQDPSGQLGPGSLRLTGTLGPDGARATLDGMTLGDWPASVVPSRIRDMYARLDLSGRLGPTEFFMDTQGRVTVRMTLDGVDLNLPFNESYSLQGSGELLRMRQTRGTIEFGDDGLDAQLTGLIDDLRYDVALDYQGFDAQSPFSADFTTRFHMDDGFRPRRFLPEQAVEKLDMFDHPEADIEATVRLARATHAGPVAVVGRAQISNGSAGYHKFPYPFTNIRGSVSFTHDDLSIDRIDAQGPTGATLVASGRFDGLGEQARVELRIEVRGVPVDDALLAALSRERRDLVEALFNQDRYQDLIDDGLIRTPKGLGPPDAPLFDFGGLADVDLVLRRHPERPDDRRWTKDTTVHLDEAGLVPEHFPLPIVAHGVELSITDDRLSLTGGVYEGLTGGQARVTAVLDQADALPGRDALPIIEITAHDIPADARLLAAIPGYRDPPNPDHPVSLRSILDNLRFTGQVECHALIGPRSDGQLGYDVEANLFHATARPVPWSPTGKPGPDDADPIVLADLGGTIYVTERIIVVDLNADLIAPTKPIAPTPVSLLTQLTLPDRKGLGDVERTGGLLPIQPGPPQPGPMLYADARAEGLDLAMPIEHAAAVVSPDLALRLTELRQARKPEGIVAIRAELDGIVGGHTETVLGVDRIETFSFEHEGIRHRVGPSNGSMELTLGVKPQVSFSAMRLPLTSGGIDTGVVSLDGDLPLVRRGRVGDLEPGEPLAVVLRQGRIEAPAINQLIGATVGPSAADWLADSRVVGAFDLDITLTPIQGMAPVPVDRAAGFALPAFGAVGVLHPRTLALDLPEGRVEFTELSGVVRFDGLAGRADAITAVAPGVSVGVDGPWSYSPGRGVAIDLGVRVAGPRLGPPVRALLPSALLSVLDRFDIQAKGPIETKDLRITGRALGTEHSALRVSGQVGVESASAVVGVSITDLSGRVDFEAEVTSRGTGFAVDIDADRLRAGRLRIENATAAILADPQTPGVVLVPTIRGRVHGGRLAGSAQTRTLGSDTRYWLDMHGSDIRAAPLFDDLLLPPEGLFGPPMPGDEAVRSAWSVSDDYTRGLLDAHVSVTGIVGKPERTVGRGIIRVAGGSVIALPGLINLVEFSNLRAPLGARLDLAEAVFYIDGTTLAFERLSASSPSVEILGHGTMDWTTRQLDLRFRSRAVHPIPFFSGLLESVRDELITTKVTGRPGNLRYAAQSFGGARRLFRALLGEPQTEQERIMSTVENASRQSKDRDRERERPPVTPAEDPAVWPDRWRERPNLTDRPQP